MKVILKFKNGDTKIHTISSKDDVNTLELSFGKIIRITENDTAYYYDFSILEKINYEKE